VASTEVPVALAADADRQCNESLSSYLEAAGWRVLRAYEGRSALAILSSEPVCLAILDRDLPEVDAARVVSAARASGRCFQVVFLGDAPGHAEAKEGEMRALACLAKPLCTASLGPVLQEALRMSGSEDGARSGDCAWPGELQAGGRVRLSVRTGPAAGGCAATVVEVRPEALAVRCGPGRASPRYMPLGTLVVVGFGSPRGWCECASRVVASHENASGLEMLLSAPARVEYTERRRGTRRAASLAVDARPLGPAGEEGAPVPGWTEEIGPAGLRAVLDRPLRGEGAVVLSLSGLRGGERALVAGRTVWWQDCGPSGDTRRRYGFRFVRLLGGRWGSLDEFVAEATGESEQP